MRGSVVTLPELVLCSAGLGTDRHTGEPVNPRRCRILFARHVALHAQLLSQQVEMMFQLVDPVAEAEIVVEQDSERSADNARMSQSASVGWSVTSAATSSAGRSKRPGSRPTSA